VHPNKLKTQINWNNYYDLNEGDYPVDGLKFVPLIYGDIFNMTEMDPLQNEVWDHSFKTSANFHDF
jgi:hypothetical protein